MILLLRYLDVATRPACGSYIQLSQFFFLLQLFPCSAIECSCCLRGSDLSVGGALPSMEKNSAHTLPSVSSLVFCLLCSPSAEEPSDVPIISNKMAIVHQRQVKSSFIPLHRHCLPTRPNAYCATRRFPGISLVVFPGKIAIKKKEAEKLRLAS